MLIPISGSIRNLWPKFLVNPDFGRCWYPAYHPLLFGRDARASEIHNTLIHLLAENHSLRPLRGLHRATPMKCHQYVLSGSVSRDKANDVNIYLVRVQQWSIIKRSLEKFPKNTFPIFRWMQSGCKEPLPLLKNDAAVGLSVRHQNRSASLYPKLSGPI
jgi:hypothetical protein